MQTDVLGYVEAIEPFAGDHAPLRPPFVGIDQRGRVMRRHRQPAGGFSGPVGAPSVLHTREYQAGDTSGPVASMRFMPSANFVQRPDSSFADWRPLSVKRNNWRGWPNSTSTH